MIRKIFLIALQAVLLVKISSGQAPAGSNYIPETPIDAQYDKYINYPANLSTGATDIVVPLYSLKTSRGIEIPINLSYHTSGVRPSDPSLPVGLGWVINPGARVSRKILGDPDGGNIPKPPVFKSAEELSPTNDIGYLQNLEYDLSRPPSSSWTSIYDPDYDVFTYSTGTGISGKFVIQQQGSNYIAIPLIATRDKIKLYTTTYGGATSISYFEITDPNGVYYRFSNPLTSYSSGMVTENGNYNGITGWMLTDIISADKSDTISFNWTNVRNTPNNFYKQEGILSEVTITDEFGGANINPNGDGNGNNKVEGYSDIPQPVSMSTESDAMNLVISGIRYKNDEVKFIYTNDPDSVTKLIRMEVYSLGVKMRQVDFYKSLFPNTSYFRLDSVSVRDENVQVVNRYHFGYNESTAFPTSPNFQLDYWGYFNGRSGNTSLLPNFSYNVAPYSGQPYDYTPSTADRNAYSNDAQTYILNSIAYPTGGKTTYEYESNMLSVYGSSPTPAGGLRVKKISQWTADGQLAETRSYAYGTDGGGDGSAMEANWYVKTSWVCRISAYGFPRYRKRIITSEPNETIFLYDYPSVTYRSVTEYVGDATGNTGKIIYNYSQAEPLPLHTFMFSQDVYGYWGRFWDNPRLEKTTYYKNISGTYTPVRYTSTVYNTPSVDTIKSLIVRRYADFGTAPLGYELNFNTYYPGLPTVFQYGDVYFNIGDPVPGFTRNVEFTASGDSIVTIQNYEYANNDYRYVKSLTTQNSNGNIATTYYTYPKDYDVGSSPNNSVAQGIKLLQDRNVVAPVIEEYTEVQPGNVIKSGKFTTYKTDKPLPENNYQLQTILPPATFSPATITSSANTISDSYYLQSTADLYDAFGNIQQATDHVGGISTVILYSYNGQHPIAVIKNAAFSVVATALGGETSVNSFASSYPTDAQVNSFLSSLRSSLSPSQVTTYTFDPFDGMTSMTDLNNRSTYYEYDSFGRLTLVRDQDSNIIKKICYNYAGQPEDCGLPTFSSTATSGTYTRQCSSGYTGTSVTYNVPNGTYTSTVSQLAADQLAQDDVIANGQNYANTNGTCIQNCSFIMTTGYSSVYNNISKSGSTVSFNLAFYPNSGTMYANGTYNVATITGGCAPSTTKTLTSYSSGHTFYITIYPTGSVVIQITSGSDVPTYSTVYFGGSYSL